MTPYSNSEAQDCGEFMVNALESSDNLWISFIPLIYHASVGKPFH